MICANFTGKEMTSGSSEVVSSYSLDSKDWRVSSGGRDNILSEEEQVAPAISSLAKATLAISTSSVAGFAASNKHMESTSSGGGTTLEPVLLREGGRGSPSTWRRGLVEDSGGKPISYDRSMKKQDFYHIYFIKS